MSNDKLMTQVSFKIGLPPGKKVTKKVLSKLLQMVIDNKPLPSNVDVRGIFWRNPNRKGSLGYWRYHKGADLSIAPKPIENKPRGSLRDAADSLSTFLQEGKVTF